MSYTREFGPEYAIESDIVATLVALGFEDIAWHNDAMPIFKLGKLALAIDSKDPEQSEYYTDRVFGDCHRFVLWSYLDEAHEDEDKLLSSTNSWASMCISIANALKGKYNV